jgi:uncharacterized protein (TIGR02646 family)
MILLPDIALPPDAMKGLQALQAEVDAAGTYADQVAEGKRLFALHNKRGNAVFNEVRRALDRMCSGARRCAYCEDSAADAIDHFRPKDLYPHLVFSWSNYVYACAPCNETKGSHFAVFVGNAAEPVELQRKPYAPIVPPLAGKPALIDPRMEDATNVMMLDLRATFLFVPLGARSPRDHARADYTIRALRLNTRDELPRARREAYMDYVALVRLYQRERDNGAPATRLAALRSAIQGRQHPTVWHEMKRQREQLPALHALFADVPEAAAW